MSSASTNRTSDMENKNLTSKLEEKKSTIDNERIFSSSQLLYKDLLSPSTYNSPATMPAYNFPPTSESVNLGSNASVDNSSQAKYSPAWDNCTCRENSPLSYEDGKHVQAFHIWPWNKNGFFQAHRPMNGLMLRCQTKICALKTKIPPTNSNDLDIRSDEWPSSSAKMLLDDEKL